MWGDQEGRGRAEVERPRGGGKRGEGLARATWLRKHSASCKSAASACECSGMFLRRMYGWQVLHCEGSASLVAVRVCERRG